MRECDFCGTPAPDPTASVCAICGSPLPAVAEAVPAEVAAADAGVTAASPGGAPGAAAPAPVEPPPATLPRAEEPVPPAPQFDTEDWIVEGGPSGAEADTVLVAREPAGAAAGDSGATLATPMPIVGVACPVCGAANDVASAFCVRCGARLGQRAAGPESASSSYAASGPSRRDEIADVTDAPTVVPTPRAPGGPERRGGAPAPPQIRCPSCRSLNDAAASFCVSCGGPLRGTPAPRPAPQAAPAPPRASAQPTPSVPPAPAPPRASTPPPAPAPPRASTPPPAPAPPPRPAAGPASGVCPSCGTINDPGTRFCVSCGSALGRDTLAGQRPPPPPASATAPRDPFARARQDEGAATVAMPAARATPAPARPPARDPFAQPQRAAPIPPPPQAPPAYAAPSVFEPAPAPFAMPEPEAGGGAKMGLLVVGGVLAGAAVGAAIALGLMVLFDVSPF